MLWLFYRSFKMVLVVFPFSGCINSPYREAKADIHSLLNKVFQDLNTSALSFHKDLWGKTAQARVTERTDGHYATDLETQLSRGA